MSRNEKPSDFHHRLDALEKRLSEKEAEIRGAGQVPPHHREQIDDMYAKAKAIREKLVQPDETRWEAVKDEIESDWDILTHVFERWVGQIDTEFRNRKP